MERCLSRGVEARETGIASAAIATAQQIGGRLGTALLNTIAAGASVAFAATHPQHAHAEALVHGYASAASWGRAVLLVAAIIAAAGERVDRGDVDASASQLSF